MEEIKDIDRWIGWLQARIPEAKNSANIFWLKVALQGYADAIIEKGVSVCPDCRKSLTLKIKEGECIVCSCKV